MRAIFKLIRLELDFLKVTIIFIGLILILFTGAFLSTLSVRIDVPNGMHENFNAHNTYRTFSITGISLGDAESLNETVFYGRIVGVTSEVVARADNGKQCYFLQADASYIAPVGSNLGGFILPENYAFDDLADVLLAGGRFPAAAGEALLGSNVADELGIGAGNTIRFGETEFLVTGVYNYADYKYNYADYKYNYADYKPESAGAHLPPMAYFVVMSADTMLDEAIFDHNTLQQAMDHSESVQKAGYKAVLSKGIVAYVDNINLAKSFFSAMTLVLGAMVFFILYSLMAIFFRQRKTQICRLKLLGAKNSTIAGVYCFIAIALVAVAVIIGSVASIAFNQYFMRLCTTLFDAQFPSHFYFAIPAILFVVMVLFNLLLFSHYQRKIKKVSIAQEVKND